MTEREYKELQEAFSRKIEHKHKYCGTRRERDAYEKAILACKSILHDMFQSMEYQRRHEDYDR